MSPSPFPLFADLAAGRATAPGDYIRTAGFAAPGEGAADYAHDPALDDAHVRANPRTSFSARGRVFRLDPQQRLTIQMFGGKADGTYPTDYGAARGTRGATDNTPALIAAIEFVQAAQIIIGSDRYYRGGAEIHFPPAEGIYDFVSTVNVRSTIAIRGHGGRAGANSSNLRWPAGMHGLIFHRPNTSEAGMQTPFAYGADGSIVEGVHLVQHEAGQVWTDDYHAIWARCRITMRDFLITGWSGNGINIVAAGASGIAGGNANSFHIEQGTIGECENGIFIDGGDANAGRVIGVDAANNRGYGIWDSSFLGNVHIGCHADNCGLMNVKGNTVGAVCWHAGHIWGVHAGKSAEASSTLPGTDDAVWVRVAAYPGPVAGAYPQWASGMAWREGGAYRMDSAAGNGNLMLGCYSEANNGPSFILAPAMVIGGTQGAPIYGGGLLLLGSNGALFTEDNAVIAQIKPAHDHFRRTILQRAGALPDFLAFADTQRIGGTAAVPEYVRFGWGGTFGSGGYWENDLIWNQGYNLSSARISFFITGPQTTRHFGRDSAQPNVFGLDELAIGREGRIHQSGAAAPSTGYHAKGEICWNDHSDAASDAVDYWVCKEAGRPGRWVSRPSGN